MGCAGNVTVVDGRGASIVASAPKGTGMTLGYEQDLYMLAFDHRAVDGDGARYDREVRPGLVVRSIAALQDAGVEADVWKIEGLDERADCRRVADQARHGGRDAVACIVLGRGASAARVEQWLRAGAGVPDYRGFAIGRTIWWDALVGFRDAKLSRAEAASLIAANYLQATDAYRGSARAVEKGNAS